MFSWHAANTAPSIRASLRMLPAKALTGRPDEAKQGQGSARWHR